MKSPRELQIIRVVGYTHCDMIDDSSSEGRVGGKTRGGGGVVILGSRRLEERCLPPGIRPITAVHPPFWFAGRGVTMKTGIPEYEKEFFFFFLLQGCICSFYVYFCCYSLAERATNRSQPRMTKGSQRPTSSFGQTPPSPFKCNSAPAPSSNQPHHRPHNVTTRAPKLSKLISVPPRQDLLSFSADAYLGIVIHGCLAPSDPRDGVHLAHFLAS